MTLILVINCGSSSLKFSLFEKEELRISGMLECISEGTPELVLGRGDEEERRAVVADDHAEAMQRVYEFQRSQFMIQGLLATNAPISSLFLIGFPIVVLSFPNCFP